MSRAAGELRMQADEFRLIRDLINRHAGLSFGPDAKSVIERKLRERVIARGLSSFGEYYELCEFHDRSELEEALEICTINETYFFREEYQLRAFQKQILERVAEGRKPGEKITVWSAGCSTGEEVYSIAIGVLESNVLRGEDARIFGSDISRRCVAAARRGIYGPSAFRATSAHLRRRYFVDCSDGAHVLDSIKSFCHFGQLNLLETSRAAVVGRVHVIFCRNVLIYFDDASRRKVIDMFYERLHPGGFLLLGHSESLLNLSTAFELVELREDLVYRKPLTAVRFPTISIPALPTLPATPRRTDG